MANPGRWWTQEGTALAESLCDICAQVQNNDQPRRERYRRFLSLYEGRPVSLESDDFVVAAGADWDPPLENLIRSACDTAQADIAGRQRPKPMFMTTGADWKARRRAKKQDMFVEAQMCLPQGAYEDTWQVMLTGFHDSTKIGDGIIKVWGDTEQEKVRVERCFPWEIYVDARDARYGDPQNLFHVYTMDRDIAIDLFCNVEGDAEGNAIREAALESAEATTSSAFDLTKRVVDSVKIREAWRLPLNDKKPGKHAIVVDGCALVEEEWTRPNFPFLRIPWNRSSVGYWGIGIAEEGERQQMELNDISARMSDRIKICSTRRTYVNPDAVKIEDMQIGGESEIIIALKDMSQRPSEEPVNPISPAEFQYKQDTITRFYELRGVSQMTANAQKPPGVDAAVAMQTLNDIQTVRFLPKARGYETAFVTLGKLFVQAAHDVAKKNGGFLVKWPGKRFLRELNWNEVSLGEDTYQVRVAPVSQFSRDPAAVIETAKEFMDLGIISPEMFAKMVQLPDFDDMMNRKTAETEWIEELMNRYLDAMSDAELKKLGGYETPEPFFTNPPAVVAQCVAIYWEAKRDGAPEFCLSLIRRYITEMMPPEAPPVQEQAPIASGAPGMVPPGAVPPPMPAPPGAPLTIAA